MAARLRSSHRSSHRHVFTLSLGFALSSFLLLAVAPSLGVVAIGEEPQEGVDAFPQVENAKFHFSGRVTSNNVFVKAGPSVNSYSTMKLDKDATVTVVGIKGEWLKIVPPEGSFSYVPQVYVTRRGDGSTGRVNSQLNVRAGSSLNGMKTTLQLKMEEGQDVKILGELDEYYKIAPPEGAFVYVNKQYVTPEKKLGEPAVATAKQTEGNSKGGDAKVTPDEGIGATTQDPEDVSVTQAPTDGVRKSVGDNGIASTEPTTKPAAIASIEEFGKLEAEFAEASKQPVIDQPIEQLTEKYQKLAGTGGLSGANKQIVEARLKALGYRGEARAELQKFAKGKEEMLKRQQALVEEKKEIDARIKQTEVSLYTAVGTLRMSSLQQGQQTLYRLTDPGTGRTVVYIRSNDAKYAGMLNQFVGIRGDLQSDERLKMKIITPTEAEAIDATKVNGTIIATLTPPSMLAAPGPASVSVDPRETGN